MFRNKCYACMYPSKSTKSQQLELSTELSSSQTRVKQNCFGQRNENADIWQISVRCEHQTTESSLSGIRFSICEIHTFLVTKPQKHFGSLGALVLLTGTFNAHISLRIIAKCINHICAHILHIRTNQHQVPLGKLCNGKLLYKIAVYHSNGLCVCICVCAHL